MKRKQETYGCPVCVSNDYKVNPEYFKDGIKYICKNDKCGRKFNEPRKMAPSATPNEYR